MVRLPIVVTGVLLLSACSGTTLCPRDVERRPLIPPGCEVQDDDGPVRSLSCENGRSGFAFDP